MGKIMFADDVMYTLEYEVKDNKLYLNNDTEPTKVSKNFRGIYRHFKGGLYAVHGTIKYKNKEYMLYEALYTLRCCLYLREYSDFVGTVFVDRPDNVTKQRQRFDYLGKLPTYLFYKD